MHVCHVCHSMYVMYICHTMHVVRRLCDQTVGAFPPIGTTTTVIIVQTPIKAIIDGGSSVIVGEYRRHISISAQLIYLQHSIV